MDPDFVLFSSVVRFFSSVNTLQLLIRSGNNGFDQHLSCSTRSINFSVMVSFNDFNVEPVAQRHFSLFDKHLHQVNSERHITRLKNRDLKSHKGNNGRLLIIGGSKDYSGAPAIAGMAAIGAGCDLVYVVSPEKSAEAIKSTSPDLIVKSLEGDKLSLSHLESILDVSENVDAVLIGPGSGIDDDTSKLFNVLVSKIKIEKVFHL